MKNRIYALVLCIAMLLCLLTSCDLVFGNDAYIEIDSADEIALTVGEVKQLSVSYGGAIGGVKWSCVGDAVSIDANGTLTALKEGAALVSAKIGTLSDSITVHVAAIPPESVVICETSAYISLGEHFAVSYTVYPENAGGQISFRTITGEGVVDFVGNTVIGSSAGTAEIALVISGVESNILTVTVTDDVTNIYNGMSEAEFYSDYTPAKSNKDAYYRTQMGFMSGSLTVPDQAPMELPYQPKQNGLFIKNTSMHYSEGGNAYTVLDVNGNIAFTVYRDGSYITIEEVAAYVWAFGDVPKNYVSNKKTDPDNSVWGEYLRLNHSRFSGNTTKYPYEPKLPNISGCGGTYSYYEIDIGTTGTDCDPSYAERIYNDGSTITRGAARIVYARFDKNGDKIVDPNEKHVFYTYNHYNDFQEYLNYLGGWGKMFGNITGGGEISSKYDYNPTPYINTFSTELKAAVVVIFIPYYDNRQAMV